MPLLVNSEANLLDNQARKLAGVTTHDGERHVVVLRGQRLLTRTLLPHCSCRNCGTLSVAG
jgi:hypothetical protein